MTTDPIPLECRACGAGYEAGPHEPWRCACGHPLDFAEVPIPGGSAPPFSRLDTRKGLWTFDQFLPVSRQVSLGEGFTPLVDAPEWDAQFKLEYVFPTGSFKDRGATTTLSRAVELGVDTVLEDSSGNAGAAIATYSARAGIDAEIYVPDSIKQSKLMAIQRAGARPVRIEGSREAVTEACVEAVGRGDGWYASHQWNPAFIAGTSTFALEVAAQRDWSAPDAVVLPAGSGTLLLGAYRGFRRLREAELIDELPRLLVGQAAGYAPLVDAMYGEWESGMEEAGAEDAHEEYFLESTGDLHEALGYADDEDTPNELADGIQVMEPPRKNQLLGAVEATDGDATALGEDAVELALDRLHRAGFYVEPTCAVAPAALRAYREAGVVDDDDDVVVPLTGSGMKTL